MKSLRLAALALLCSAVPAFAQSASLTADNTALAPAGGTVALTARVIYQGEPGAVGWAISLPANWALVKVSGPNVPAIAPDSGATGTLEFAFTQVPAQAAEFVVLVRYPANAATTTAAGTALVRTDGKLDTIAAKPLQLTGVSTVQGQSRD